MTDDGPRTLRYGSRMGEDLLPEEPALPADDEVTTEVSEPPIGGFSMDEDPTIERVVPASIAASRCDDDFNTELVTFSEILARIGPRHLGGPLPPIRDDLFTTAETAVETPVSTTELDGEWPDESKTKS